VVDWGWTKLGRFGARFVSVAFSLRRVPFWGVCPTFLVGKEHLKDRLCDISYLIVQICLFLRLYIARTAPSVIYERTSLPVNLSILLYCVIQAWGAHYFTGINIGRQFPASLKLVLWRLHNCLDTSFLLFVLPTLISPLPWLRFMDTAAVPVGAKRVLHCIDIATANSFHQFMCANSEAPPRCLC